MVQKVSELLKAGRALVDTEDKWTRGVWALNAEGQAVGAYDISGCKFCSGGALAHANDSEGNPEDLTYDAAVQLLKSAMSDHIASFNDSHTHSEVMAAWDKAIDNAEISERIFSDANL